MSDQTDSFAFDVFLSHAAADKSVVRELAERLRKDGLKVWFDEWIIKPGDSIPAKIEDGLEQSRLLVLCLSANAVGRDWPLLESGTFRFRDPLNKERRFIPLRLDDTPIKGSLGQFLAIDWQEAARDQEYPTLLSVCQPESRAALADQAAGDRPVAQILTLGHVDSVQTAALSPDGKSVLSGSADHTVRLWDVATGRCECVLDGHTDRVYCVSWSPDGRRALSGSADHTVRLWDIATGRCERVLEGHFDRVWSVSWSPDGRSALSGSQDKTVRLWDVATGRSERVLDGHTSFVYSVSWSPDGRRALSGSADHTVRLWDVTAGRCERVLEGHTAFVYSVSWGPDGWSVLSGSADETVRLWDVATGRCECVLDGHRDWVNSVSWSPDGGTALSGSADRTVRLWDVASGRCERVLEGHFDRVWSVSWSPDGRKALSGSDDHTVRLWDVATGRCERILEGHTGFVNSVSWSPDGRTALSGSADNTVRLWDVVTGRCERVLRGHTSFVYRVSWSPDGGSALSGSRDTTVLLWDVATGRCERIFAGHTGDVWSVSWSPDGRRALSGSEDRTIRLWDVATGRCERVLEGHTGPVWNVSWSPDGKSVLSGSADTTVRLWDVPTGRCERVLEGHTNGVDCVSWSPDGRSALSATSNGVIRIWDLCDLSTVAESDVGNDLAVVSKIDVQYTNAKVLVVGDTHAGKTGLTRRLATGQWQPSESSTVGAWSTQWKLSYDAAHLANDAVPVEREIWLWDFGGQADQRLVHQLYMDRAALILLLFDADQEEVLAGLRDWRTALRRCVPASIPQFLVAGRIDAGFKASRGKLQSFCREEQLAFYETSAVSGQGCPELRDAIRAGIDWKAIPITTTERLFKVLKDEILKLRDEGQVLHTFKELRDLLWSRLPDEGRIPDATLRTVIGLLAGPGIVQELDFGTYVLLKPEWISTYAQAVLVTLRSDRHELGSLPLTSIAEGKLIYQSVGRQGVPEDIRRLPPAEERVVLGEMERQLMERGLCLRQGDKLVFPSHCGRERPVAPESPTIVVSYTVEGYLDDIYATLVVKLADCEAFTLTELWREAADFRTLSGDRRLGIKLARDSASRGEISVYFGPGVTEPEQVIFANYIHGHLHGRSDQVQRLRHYVCPKCQTAKGNSAVLMKRLGIDRQQAATECDNCLHRFSLWDELEKAFASNELRQQVDGLNAQDLIRLDSRRKGKLLALEVAARITSADQKSFEIPGTEDEGIDIQMEFTDDQGKGTGQQLYLQLKSGNSHLRARKSDGDEIFDIEKQAWVEYWLKLPFPVMLVVGTFQEDERRGHSADRDRLEFAEVRWMEISSVLKHDSENGTKPVKQIVFKGERLDVLSVMRWRAKMLANSAAPS